MTANTIEKRLAKAVAATSLSANFFVAGDLPSGPIGLIVDGVGKIRFTVSRATAKQLVDRCRLAPYGKGTETLVDPEVRNAYELDPNHFSLSPDWPPVLAATVRKASEGLGLPPDRVEAKLYKLLVYERGGFFLPHRDSEKLDGMVASLIVALPNRFSGGDLVVRHGNVEKRARFRAAAEGESASFAAFYADCEHEVREVTRGMRICLAYNLVLKPGAAAPPRAADDDLAGAIRAWAENNPKAPLVFAFDHHYTERGLTLDSLKGSDRALAELVVPAAGDAECRIHLAQVARHVCSEAHGSSDYDESDYDEPDYDEPDEDYETGEVYDDELTAEGWANLDGTKAPWGPLELESNLIVSSLPLAKWKPTREEYEGFTGNAGNTLDRWYHRSALVIWPLARHYEFVAESGHASCVPMLSTMIAKLGRTAVKRQAEARAECVQFARALARTRWSTYRPWEDYRAEPSRPIETLADLLVQLKDAEATTAYLANAARKPDLPIEKLVVAAVRDLGWRALADALRGLLAEDPKQDYWEARLRARDGTWLEAFCLAATDDPECGAFARELCSLATARFTSVDVASSYAAENAVLPTSALAAFFRAMATCGADAALNQAVRFVQNVDSHYTLEGSQVPCLETLVPWARERFGETPAPVDAWLTSTRATLEAAVADVPKRPTDWARPSEMRCRCERCRQLGQFLADPTNETGRISGLKAELEHLLGEIQVRRYDASGSMDKSTRPFALTLRKNTLTYDTLTACHTLNVELLKRVRALGDSRAAPTKPSRAVRPRRTR